MRAADPRYITHEGDRNRGGCGYTNERSERAHKTEGDAG